MTVHREPHENKSPAGRADDPIPLFEAPRLRLVDAETGELLCEDCKRARAEAEEAQRRLEDAERELRQYRAKMRQMTNDKARERQDYVRRSEVEAVFAEWQDKCRHPKSRLTPDRFDAIKRIIEMGYKPEDISRAIEYFAAFPYVEKACRVMRGNPAKRFDDIELLCRSGSKFERFANLGYLHIRNQRMDQNRPV